MSIVQYPENEHVHSRRKVQRTKKMSIVLIPRMHPRLRRPCYSMALFTLRCIASCMQDAMHRSVNGVLEGGPHKKRNFVREYIMTVMCDNCTQAYVRRNQISTGDPGKRRLETDVIMYHQYSSSVCRILVCSICMTSEAGR